MVAFSFLLTADSDRRNNFTKCDGMFGVHVLCAMYRWKSKCLSSFKESLPIESDAFQFV
jgi:hypothetical protein